MKNYILCINIFYIIYFFYIYDIMAMLQNFKKYNKYNDYTIFGRVITPTGSTRNPTGSELRKLRIARGMHEALSFRISLGHKKATDERLH